MPVYPTLRVLHVCETLPGGIASHIDELMRPLTDLLGPESQWVVAPSSHRHHLSAVTSSQLFTYHRTGRNIVSFYNLWSTTKSAIRAIDPQIIHLHSTFAGAIIRATIGPRRRAPLVYCPHGWSFNVATSPLTRFLFAAIERALAKRTAAIIAVSRFERDLALQNGIPAQLLEVIPNGVSRNHPIDTASRPRLDERLINILFAGRLDRAKGFDYLCEELTNLSRDDLCVHVIGPSVIDGNDLVNKLPSSCRKFVKLYGWLPRSDVLAMMMCADAVVIPSRWEGLPIVALEAMRAGCAVIATNRASLPEVVIPNVTGLLANPDVPGELANILDNTTKDNLRRMGQAGRLHFINYFTSDRQAAAIAELYCRLTGWRAPSGDAIVEDQHLSYGH